MVNNLQIQHRKESVWLEGWKSEMIENGGRMKK